MSGAVRLLVTNLISTFLTAAIVAGSALTLEDRWGHRGGSVVGDLIHRALVGRHYGCRCFIDPTVCIVRQPEGLTAFDPMEDDWKEFTRLQDARPQDLFVVDMKRCWSCSGFWAITRKCSSISLDVSSVDRAMSAHPNALTRASAARYFITQREIDLPALAEQDVRTSTIVWAGYAENTIVAAAALGFIVSLRCVPMTWRRWRDCCPLGRIRRGLCPTCAYPVVGLPGNTCPECGRESFPFKEKPRLESRG